MDKFTLCHKDIDVLDFEMEQNGIIKSILNVWNIEHLPIGIKKINSSQILPDSLNEWWKHRCIPASRNNIEKALIKLNFSSTLELQKRSLGLSLSDHYWIKPENFKYTYKDVNFYQNSFSNDVGRLIFDNDYNGEISNLNFFSPDNSSDGNLAKKWIIDSNNRRLLIKGGDPYSPQEPFNEVIASYICKELNIPHVEYSVFSKDNVYFSSCPCFVTLALEFVNAKNIIRSFDYDFNSKDEYSFFVDCCNKIGLNNIEKDLCNLFIVDFIMANRDRHYRNFGFLRNPDTLEWIGIAPVFDTGLSLYSGLSKYDLENENFISSKVITAKPFAQTQLEQIALLPIKKYCTHLDFSQLNNISTYINKVFSNNSRMDAQHKALICKNLIYRIQEVVELL